MVMVLVIGDGRKGIETARTGNSVHGVYRGDQLLTVLIIVGEN